MAGRAADPLSDSGPGVAAGSWPLTGARGGRSCGLGRLLGELTGGHRIQGRGV